MRLSELRRERRKLKEDIATEEVTIAAVREELSTEQLQLDNERKQIEARDSELKEEEVSLSHHHTPHRQSLLNPPTHSHPLIALHTPPPPPQSSPHSSHTCTHSHTAQSV